MKEEGKPFNIDIKIREISLEFILNRGNKIGCSKEENKYNNLVFINN